jgi:hypothetical protein
VTQGTRSNYPGSPYAGERPKPLRSASAAQPFATGISGSANEVTLVTSPTSGCTRSLPHKAHARTHAHTYTQFHARNHTCSHALTHSLTYARPLTHARPNKHTRSRSLTHHTNATTYSVRCAMKREAAGRQRFLCGLAAKPTSAGSHRTASEHTLLANGVGWRLEVAIRSQAHNL